MKTSVSLVYTEQGTNKQGQKSITDVNPNATGAEIKAFTTALNGLTTNIYGETNRVQVINIDTEEVPVIPPEKETPTFTLKGADQSELRAVRIYQTGLANSTTVNVETNSTGAITYKITQDRWDQFQTAVYSVSNTQVEVYANGSIPSEAGTSMATLVIHLAETDEYKSVTQTIGVKRGSET